MSVTSRSTTSSADRAARSGAGLNILGRNKRKIRAPAGLTGSPTQGAAASAEGVAGARKGSRDVRSLTQYSIRIYRANGAYHVVSVGFEVTVGALEQRLKDRLLTGEDREMHKLYLKDKGRGGIFFALFALLWLMNLVERILMHTERPADIVRRRLEQAGYDVRDGLQLLDGEAMSFLLRFVYKSQLLGPAVGFFSPLFRFQGSCMHDVL